MDFARWACPDLRRCPLPGVGCSCPLLGCTSFYDRARAVVAHTHGVKKGRGQPFTLPTSRTSSEWPLLQVRWSQAGRGCRWGREWAAKRVCRRDGGCPALSACLPPVGVSCRASGPWAPRAPSYKRVRRSPQLCLWCHRLPGVLDTCPGPSMRADCLRKEMKNGPPAHRTPHLGDPTVPGWQLTIEAGTGRPATACPSGLTSPRTRASRSYRPCWMPSTSIPGLSPTVLMTNPEPGTFRFVKHPADRRARRRGARHRDRPAHDAVDRRAGRARRRALPCFLADPRLREARAEAV